VRFSVADAPAEPVAVPRWDESSPQELFTIDGVLYQRDSGFFYRVQEDTVTIRLKEGVRDWADLLARVSPETAAGLEPLAPSRANKLGIIDLAVPDGRPIDWSRLLHDTGLVKYAEVSTRGVWVVAPNDTQYSQQWALNNTGQTGGTAGADVHAEDAWTISTGDPAIVVGVLDSGTFVDHPDLAANVWHNEGEIPDNGIDDDGNGFIDDWEGWDFGNGNNVVESSNFHGTHVTGIINAATNNGQGIAGLAGGWDGNGARSMAVAVGESGPIGGILDDSIIYAADNGAQIITMSLSVGSSAAINDALDYAYNTKDVFIDCAAGNNGPSVSYPANRVEVMAVASTDHNDNRSSFSNQGSELEIAAPGSNILSTQLNGSYGTSSGTSFAAPYVAGLAALVRGVNPGLPAPDVRQLIIDSADDVEAPGFDTETGWGRINAFEALSLTATSDGIIRLDADRFSCDDTLTLTVADTDLAGTGSILVTASSSAEAAGEGIVLVEIGSGAGVFRGTVTTSDGTPAPDGLLQVIHADTITASYLDADDGQGGINVPKTALAVTDCAAPAIFDVVVTDNDDDSAIVRWTTDEAGTSLVRYGTFLPPDQQASAAGLVTDHAVFVGGLAECTTYRFEVESADDLGNTAVGDNGGLLFSFETFANVPGVGVVPCHRGQASLDDNVYGCDETVQIAVTDIDLDTDSQIAESIDVLMTSTSEPEGEWITLTEISTENSRFEGSVVLGAGGTVGDGLLEAAAGDLLTVTYFDEDDGDGAARRATFTALADCVAPSIQNVQVTAITSTLAAINWSTDEPATSRVDFGPDAALGSVAEDLTLKTSHQLFVSAFDACDRVFFRVSSTDTHGDVQVLDAGGQPFEFNLSQIGGLVFHDNFETDAGWSTPAEWERGVPQGLGSGSGDPTSAYSGSSILGYDLTGQGASPGDYEEIVKRWALSPVMNTTGLTQLELILRRKLGVASGDDASIAVFNPGQHIVWNSGSSIDDADWVEFRLDISERAGDQPLVQIGVGIESEDPGTSYGWNVDELIVKDSTQPDYEICGGCAGEPSFGGATAAFDTDPCAPTGVLVSWEPAPAWGTGGVGTYDVHRGTTPDFLPDLGNRIASGIAGVIYFDDTAPADTDLWYVVRARNDQSCDGGEGAPDTNLVRLAARETVAQPVPPALGDSVQVVRVGVAHVRVSWDPVPGADHYVVERSDFTDFGSPEVIGTTAATFFEDVNAATDNSFPFYSYRVSAVNSCGEAAP
jgi:subtilisin family serine protease